MLLSPWRSVLKQFFYCPVRGFRPVGQAHIVYPQILPQALVLQIPYQLPEASGLMPREDIKSQRICSHVPEIRPVPYVPILCQIEKEVSGALPQSAARVLLRTGKEVRKLIAHVVAERPYPRSFGVGKNRQMAVHVIYILRPQSVDGLLIVHEIIRSGDRMTSTPS